MVERKIQWRYVGIAFVMTAFMIVGIMLAGKALTNYKIDDLENQMSDLEATQRSTVLTNRLADDLGREDCSAQRIMADQNLGDLYQARQALVKHKQTSKIESPQFEKLKKKYMLISIENYLINENIDQTCNNTRVKILYFHSDDCDKCTAQGKVLTKYRKKYDERLLVYPLDTDYDLEPVNFLKEYYEIDEYPALVIGDEVKERWVSQDELESEIKERIDEGNSTGVQSG